MKTGKMWITVIAVCLLMTSVVPAQQQVFVRDIMDTPQRFFNLSVQITGEVVSVQTPPSAEERGFYVLLDNSDRTIKVVANTLPAPQSQVTVRGIVQVFPENQESYIRESMRIPQGGEAGVPAESSRKENILIYILIGLIIIIVVILMAVLLRKPASMERDSHPDAGTTGEKRTRQVTAKELDNAVGGLRTKAVPDPLASVEVIVGPNQGRSFPLGYETTIGRLTGDIVLEDESVSRKHARIIFAKGVYTLENMSGTNPVILNSSRIESQKELNDGDEIICGVVKLQFKLL